MAPCRAVHSGARASREWHLAGMALCVSEVGRVIVMRAGPWWVLAVLALAGCILSPSPEVPAWPAVTVLGYSHVNSNDLRLVYVLNRDLVRNGHHYAVLAYPLNWTEAISPFRGPFSGQTPF